MITGTYNLAVNPQWRNVQQQEVFLECDTTNAPVTINLFEIVELNRFWGVKIIISDANNNAGTNNITVNASGSDTVDDDTTNQIVINTNGSSVSFQVASETQWLAIESVVAGLTPTAPYKVYTALLTQTLDEPPVPNILENTIGDIEWTRDSAGIYYGTLPDAFTDKTFLQGAWGSVGRIYGTPAYIDDATNVGTFMTVTKENSNYIRITTLIFPEAFSDNLLQNFPIEIRVYN